MANRLYPIIIMTAILTVAAGCTEGFGPSRAGAGEPSTLHYSRAASERPRTNMASRVAELGPQSTLDDYIQHALLNNPQLEAQFKRWKAALEGGTIEGTLPDPQFTYTYFIVRMGAGPAMEQRQRMALTQVFPWFGKLRLRSQQAMDLAAAEEQRFQAQRLQLIYQVADAWYDYYYLARSVENTRQVRQLTEHMEGVARARYRAADTDHADVIRAQIELGRLDDQLASQEDLRRPLVARLNALLNRPTGAELPVPPAMEPAQVQLDEEQLLQLADRANPELQAIDHENASRRRAVDLARKQYYPDVMLGLEWMDMTVMPGRRGVSSEDNWTLMAGINVPIWRHKYAAQERQARFRHMAGQRQRENAANQLQAELRRVFYDIRDAERRINLYGDTLLPRARDSVQVTEAGFRAGTSTFLDLLDSLRVLLEFELSYQQAVAMHGRRLAELQKLSGSTAAPFSGNVPESPSVQTGDAGLQAEPVKVDSIVPEEGGDELRVDERTVTEGQ